MPTPIPWVSVSLVRAWMVLVSLLSICGAVQAQVTPTVVRDDPPEPASDIRISTNRTHFSVHWRGHPNTMYVVWYGPKAQVAARSPEFVGGQEYAFSESYRPGEGYQVWIEARAFTTWRSETFALDERHKRDTPGLPVIPGLLGLGMMGRLAEEFGKRVRGESASEGACVPYGRKSIVGGESCPQAGMHRC
jgi:hypothetical protein